MDCIRCGGKGVILGKPCSLCAPKCTCHKQPKWSPGPRQVRSEGRGGVGGRIPMDLDSGDYSKREEEQ